MAEDKPVRKTVRKAATQKRSTKRVATKRVISKERSVTSKRRSGLTLKTVLAVALILIGSSAGAFYVGYSAEAEINVTARMSDESNYVNVEDHDNNEKPVPRPNAFRPVLEVADREQSGAPDSAPAPAVEGEATSTPATASTTDDGTDSEAEEVDEANTDSAEAPADGEAANSGEEASDTPTTETESDAEGAASDTTTN